LPAPAKVLGETSDTFVRGGAMEPAARTVASGPEWPMRAGGPGSGHRQPLGTQGAPAAVQASDRPLQGWGPCSCVPQGAQAGATRRASGLATRYIYRGVGHDESPSGSPFHSASGLSSPVGQVAVASACALVDLWVLRLPFPVRCEARLSRPCPLRVGVVALPPAVGGGTGSGS